MSRRTDRVSHLIQRELGDLIQKELTDSRIGFVTVSRVETTTDLAHAKVFVSVLGSEKESRDSLVGLSHSASYLRTALSKLLKMRTVPKLQFILDKNLEHGFRINQILSDLDREANPKPDFADAEDSEDTLEDASDETSENASENKSSESN